MGCRIITGHQESSDGVEAAVLFCSTTMVAFGPVMDSQEEAEKFCEWIPGDPRSYSHKNLMDKYNEFVRLYVCECGAVRCDHCDYCDLVGDYTPAEYGKHRDKTKPEGAADGEVSCELEEEPEPGERYECGRCGIKRRDKELQRRKLMEQDEMDRANHRGKYANRKAGSR